VADNISYSINSCEGGEFMAEITKCPQCGKYINLEIDIYRDNENNIICNKCGQIIKLN